MLSESLCAKCKGRLWCGKERCPLLVKFYAQTKVKPLIDSTFWRVLLHRVC